MAWTYAIQGWRGKDGVLKPAGEPLRAAAREYLSMQVGGWRPTRPWPASVRDLPAAALPEWQRLTGRRWPVDLRVVGILLFGFYAPGEGDPGALQCEAYAWGGRRVPHRVRGANAARWTLGAMDRRAFQVASASRDPASVAICESPTTALAIAAARPRALVLAVSSLASCAPRVRGHLPRHLPVRLYSDRRGIGTARAGSRALEKMGLEVMPSWLPGPDVPAAFDFAAARRRAEAFWTGAHASRRTAG